MTFKTLTMELPLRTHLLDYLTAKFKPGKVQLIAISTFLNIWTPVSHPQGKDKHTSDSTQTPIRDSLP